MVGHMNDRGRAASDAARHSADKAGSDRSFAGRYSDELRRKLRIRPGDNVEPFADAIDQLGAAFGDTLEATLEKAVTRAALRPIIRWGTCAIIALVAIALLLVVATDNWRTAREIARYEQWAEDLRVRYRDEFDSAVGKAVDEHMRAFEPLRPIVRQLAAIETRRPGYSLWVISPAAEQHFEDGMSDIVMGKKDRKK